MVLNCLNFENSQLKEFITKNWGENSLIFPFFSNVDKGYSENDALNLTEYFLTLDKEEIPEILKYYYLDQVDYLSLHPYGDTYLWVLHFSQKLPQEEIPEPLFGDYLGDYLRDNLEDCQVHLFKSPHEFTIMIYGSIYDTNNQL